MSKSTHHPHDKYFRECFAQHNIAIELIRFSLSPSLFEQLDCSRIAPYPTGFVGPDNTSHQADLIYLIPFKQEESCDCLFHCEFQSSIDTQMVRRNDRYHRLLLEDYETRYPERRVPNLQTAILYNGHRPYRWSMHFSKMNAAERKRARQIWSFEPHVIDIKRLSDSGLFELGKFGLICFVTKHRKTKELDKFFSVLGAQIKQLKETLLIDSDFTGKLYKYIMNSFSSRQKDDFISGLSRLKNIGETTMHTMADYFMDVGMEKGTSQGLERGLEQGLEKGMSQGLERGLEQGLEKGMSQGLEQGLKQGMSKGREQGISTGKELGIIEGRKQIIEQLLDSGFSREKVADLLELKKEELDSI